MIVFLISPCKRLDLLSDPLARGIRRVYAGHNMKQSIKLVIHVGVYSEHMENYQYFGMVGVKCKRYRHLIP